RQDQVIVRKLARVAIEAMGRVDSLLIQVDRFDVAHKGVYLTEKLSQRIDDGVDLEVAGCDFVKHRGKQEKIVPADQSYFRFPTRRQLSLQPQGRVDAAESAPEDQNARE